jgi:hypothetical protein
MDNADSKVNIIILDACRNNPFAASARSASRGLAMLDAPRGTYIAYSTGINQTAEDGDGKNSPYTDALAKAMVEPGVKLEDAFKEARRTVEAATDNKQVPWETTSITGDFYFTHKDVTTPKPEPAADEAAWNKIIASTNVADFDSFLQAFPQSRFAAQAKSRRASLTGTASSAETACTALVQGKIVWNDSGSTSWSPANVQSLCRGSTKPAEPGRCFDRVMHGGINAGGSAKKWEWSNALNLCKGTSSADATISCFQAKIAAGAHSNRAIAQCQSGAVAASATLKTSPAAESEASAVPGSPTSPPTDAPPPTTVAATPVVEQNPPPAGPSFVLLGRWKTPSIAADRYHQEQQKYPDLLADKRPTLIEDELKDGGTGYRLRVGPFPSPGQASDFCDRLKQAGGFCLLPTPGETEVRANLTNAVYSRGKLKIPQSYMFNIEKGEVTPKGHGGLWFEASTANDSYLVPMNGAQLAPGDFSHRSFGACAVETYSTDRLSLRNLAPGSFVCVKTGGGRIGQMRIDAVTPTAPHTLALDYVVWQ